ncbi:MAG: NAD(P)-dependent glycerol-3-phosphate dehydrogenase [Sphingobacteriales bacterium]|jgi:glycerol-3-phosphate dehydrogenase (NAD(P)+)|nr:NAD(P)-dependent glycerol-3-phosphate dehydrogenase [Sphingobacteriales bacterium]MBP9140787.1 NAD(P)-dependent glycerol-3-phosphate dehydrogenase [Chitinophagales bacterium]MDA0199430.1 NAD(P)-dependent glycerol-3-phosphate dehydrogenase [Bacteroidota bacterium]MBK6889755.1 NAD(P)-dependent glycerol-3-phosphate dehydrogenase [Sphingobacteriales bacterium]MBK7527731.1 NAD(P)-dependent glycerol-3-phosphate dehydrogenase [Sphingobacteriales bacterium]
MTYGVIGGGSFGTAIANLIAHNGKVLLLVRKPEVVNNILNTGEHRGQKMHPNIQPILDAAQLCQNCQLLFPVIPSDEFKGMINSLAKWLRPDHVLIHGTKGLNIQHLNYSSSNDGKIQKLSREHIKTMSDLICQQSVVIRVGCLSGPNLAREIAAGQPTATVIASRFDEVIELGKTALKSERFKVYGSHDITGIELAGVLKNIMAIGSGMLSGLGFGENTRAMLITRGLGEMVKLGQALGAEAHAFMGLAGIGDLVATCSSSLSRNYTVGYQLSQGKTLPDIIAQLGEVAEGVKTIKLARGLIENYHIQAPITESLYNIIFNNMPISEGLRYLMEHQLDKDADFMLT